MSAPQRYAQRHVDVIMLVLGRALGGAGYLGDGITESDVHAALEFVESMQLPTTPALVYFGNDSRTRLAVYDPNPLPEMDMGDLAMCKGLVDCAAVMIRSDLDRRFPVRDKR